MRTALAPRLVISIAIVLMAALLLAQLVGLAHRIGHSPLASAHLVTPGGDDADASHSCISFDAAAVADSISLPPFNAPLMPGAAVTALWTAFASWDPPPVLHFSSRGPPLS